MQRSANNLSGYTISASDGEIGKVYEFYFDDITWTIRYLVVEPGSWLSERKVLIPHSALGQIDWDAETFQVNLTMEQVRNSPDIDTDKTVSRQHEIELLSYYAYPIYWGEIYYPGSLEVASVTPVIDKNTLTGKNYTAVESPDDPHLRSTKKVEGYHIHAKDGEIGHVEDFIVDDEKWKICLLVIDTKNWLPGRKVLIPIHYIERIDWAESEVYVKLTLLAIKNSPEFDLFDAIGKDYESEISNHYENHIL